MDLRNLHSAIECWVESYCNDKLIRGANDEIGLIDFNLEVQRKETDFVVQLASKLNLLNHLFLRYKSSDLSILDAYFDDVYARFSSYQNSSKENQNHRTNTNIYKNELN